MVDKARRRGRRRATYALDFNGPRFQAPYHVHIIRIPRLEFAVRRLHSTPSLTAGSDHHGAGIAIYLSLHSMGVDTQEIIDLTEDDKVIVVGSDSDDGAPTPAKRSISRKSRPVRDEDTNGRSNQPEESSQAILTPGQSTPEAGSSSQAQEGKQRKPRRKKKRKQVVLAEQKDGEEGEIVEVDVTEESAAVSREQSSERIASGSGEKSGTKSKRKHREQETSSNGNGAWVSGQDVEAMPVNLEETNGPVESTTSKRPGKHERKRKRRERERESELPSRPRSRSPESPPLFFVDNHPAEIPSNARPPVPPAIAQAKPAESKGDEEGPSLLLPPHVFILEGDVDIPVEILPPPPADSDEDDYIEYLDYDDDRRVCLFTFSLEIDAYSDCP